MTFSAYPRTHMIELEQVWPKLIDAAANNASAEGRHEVAEYLRLKATNDTIRATAANWLIDTFVEIAGGRMQRFPHLTIEREEPYSFARGTGTMVGTLIDVRLGVRRLGLAVGWARTPSHGIMQKGALAFARITHFGMPDAGEEFKLIRGPELPSWVTEDGVEVTRPAIEKHVDLLLS